jgi:ABC-type branched-subunit amino acid transport system substrate-binding protein
MIAFSAFFAGSVLSSQPSISAEPSDDGAMAMQNLIESHGSGRVVLLHDRRGKWGGFVNQANKYLITTEKIVMMMAVDVGNGADKSIATSISKVSPDLVVCICLDDDASGVVRNLRADGYNGVFVGTGMTPF